MEGKDQSFEDRKERIFDFMDEVKRRREQEEREKEIANRPETKLRKLELTKKAGVDQCLNTVMGTLYRNSLPVNSLLPQSTCINGSIQHLQNPMELQDQMGDFLNGRSGGNGTSYYVHEAIKRTNSPALKRLMEGCTRIVNEQYADKTANPETITDEDFSFKLSGESEEKMNELMDSLQLNDLSEVIRQNVKTTAINEIEAAKSEKETRDSLEKELASNDDLTTESAIDAYLKANNLARPTNFYQPSLFEGILIGKFNNLSYMESASDSPIREIGYFSEKVINNMIEKIKNMFPNKEERETLEHFKSFTGAYGELLAKYQTEIKEKNHNEIIKNCKDGLSSKRVDPKAPFTLPDMDAMEETLKRSKTQCESVLANPKTNAKVEAALVVVKRQYNIAEALKQYESSVKFLNAYFKDTKAVKDLILKYGKKEKEIEAKYSKGELKRAKKAISGLLRIETMKILMHFYFIKAVTKCTEKLTKQASRMTAKELAFEEAVKEYTMLSCIKALRLEDFDIPKTKAMATQYAEM